MDANGTRYHLLLGWRDWSACRLEDLAWDSDRNELTLQPHTLAFVASPRDTPPTPGDRRGAGCDQFGNVYWIAESGREILVDSVGTGVTAHFWAAGDNQRLRPSPRFGDFQAREPAPAVVTLTLAGLAVTEHHFLAVGVLQPAGLLVFDLHTGGEPRQVLWPDAVPFEPYDLAPAPGGGLWVLDRHNRCFWALDRHFEVIRHDQADTTLSPATSDEFQPVEQGTTRQTNGRTFPRGIDLAAASPVSAIDPVAIEGLPDGTTLVLDRDAGSGFAQVFRYRFGQLLGQPASTDTMKPLIEDVRQPSFRLLGHDFVFVPEHCDASGVTLADRLYVVAADGNQAFAFEPVLRGAGLDLYLEPRPEYLPMRRFGGKAVIRAGAGALYDFGQTWLPLVEQRRRRYALHGSVLAGPFDSGEADCVWHRLMVDGCIPPEADVQVWSRAANDLEDLSLSEWQLEPRPYLRGDGSEMPFVSTVTGSDTGTWELLLQSARGRRLELKIDLSGDGRTTPRVRAVRAYYPRFSYLAQYLPAVYRDDAESASFLDRFLANLEGFSTRIEDAIANVRVLFDASSAPAEALDWLASWFDVVLDPAWDECARRLLIRHLIQVFQYRGTTHGLKTVLHVLLDEAPGDELFSDRPPPSDIRIVEDFVTRRTPMPLLGASWTWTPDEGAGALNDRYWRKLGLPGWTPFPISAPDGETGKAWRRFAEETLGFVPSATSADTRAWQDFLARRYRRIEAVNAAHATNWTSFDVVPLPGAIPHGKDLLQDWYAFEAMRLAVQRTAHRFKVLLPARTLAGADAAGIRERVDLVRRIVALEKPAHTSFDVGFYWALFRAGDARLGHDSALVISARTRPLLAPLVLDHGYLSEAYLDNLVATGAASA